MVATLQKNVADAPARFRDQIGLGSVENTADADKPVSIATQAALDLKLTTTALDSVLAAKSAATGGVSSVIGVNANGELVRAYPNLVANVKDFGAEGDGNSHPLSEGYSTLSAAQAVYPDATSLSDELDWAASQAALANHSFLYFPPGSFRLSKALTVVGRPVRVMGSGVSVSELICADNGISINNSSLSDDTSVTITDVTLTASTAGTKVAVAVSGTAERTTCRSQLLIDRVALRGSATGYSWQKGIVGINVSDSHISNTAIIGDRLDWSLLQRAIQISDSVDITFDALRLYWGDTGIYLSGDSEGITLSHSHIVGFEIGHHVYGSNGTAMQHVTHNHMNTNQRGVWITSADGTSSRHSDVSNNNLIQNVPTSSGVGGETDYDWIGVEIDGQQSQVSNNAIEGSLSKASTGVVVDALSDNLIVSDNYIGGCSNRAVDVQSGATDCIISGNTGSSSAAIVDAGTRTRLFGNEDNLWKSEVHGGATVVNGTTSIVVSHTLSSTPTIADIMVVARSWGSATKAWISDVTATQFTINVDVNPGASNATFTWWASTQKSNL